jgi:hypothetical protein
MTEKEIEDILYEQMREEEEDHHWEMEYKAWLESQHNEL